MRKYLMSFILVFFLLIPVISYGKSDEVYIVKIDGEINGAMVSYVNEAIEKAQETNAKAIIFEIDTYGGQIVAAEDIKNSIINTDLKTIAFVNNKCESAGVLIAIACEKIYMTSTATIGSAETIPKTEKNISFWRTLLKDTAQYRKRNAELIAAMADSDIEIKNISKKGKLVNLTSKESLDYGISDGVVKSYEEILQKEKIPESNIVVYNMSVMNKFANILAKPAVSSALLTLAFCLFILEIFVPGFGIPGTLAIIFFGLFFMGNIIVGNSNFYALVLFILGIILLIVELIVPGFGLPGISGIICTVAGIVMSMKNIEYAIITLLIAFILASCLTVLLFKKGYKLKIAKKAVLLENNTAEKGYVSVDFAKLKVGDEAVVETPLKPTGFIIFNDEKYEAISDNGFIDKNELVVVVKVEKSKIFVRRKK